MKFIKIILSAALLLALMAACVSNEDGTVDYENNVVTPSLEIPPDLITRSQQNNASPSLRN